MRITKQGAGCIALVVAAIIFIAGYKYTYDLGRKMHKERVLVDLKTKTIHKEDCKVILTRLNKDKLERDRYDANVEKYPEREEEFSYKRVFEDATKENVAEGMTRKNGEYENYIICPECVPITGFELFFVRFRMFVIILVFLIIFIMAGASKTVLYEDRDVRVERDDGDKSITITKK